MNRKTKVFYGNQYIGGFNCTGRNKKEIEIQLKKQRKNKVKNFFKALLFIIIIVSITYVFTASNKSTVQQVVVVDKGNYPVLDRIADCESGERLPSGKAIKGSAKHYDNKGQVLMVGNADKTVDIGKYQINNYHWGKKATELGFDLTKEKDNKAMAEFIYENSGTEPWKSSITCWR